jgi:shikimate kinase
MEIINAHGLSIWLTTNAQRITERLCLPEQKAKRPAIAHMTDAEVLDYVTRQMAERKPHYEQAMLRFDSTRLESVEEIAATAHALATLLTSL